MHSWKSYSEELHKTHKKTSAIWIPVNLRIISENIFYKTSLRDCSLLLSLQNTLKNVFRLSSHFLDKLRGIRGAKNI